MSYFIYTFFKTSILPKEFPDASRIYSSAYNLFFKGQMESKISEANGMIGEIMFISADGWAIMTISYGLKNEILKNFMLYVLQVIYSLNTNLNFLNKFFRYMEKAI